MREPASVFRGGKKLRQRGVDGVPTFFIGEYALRGAQSPETMRKVLKRASEVFGNAESN